MRSASGYVTYFEYDINGDCILSWYFKDGMKHIETTVYDESRRETKSTFYSIPGGVCEPGKTIDHYRIWYTVTEYNGAGLVVRSIDKEGIETIYTYDTRGLATESKSRKLSGSEATDWQVQRIVYDALGQAIAISEYSEGTLAMNRLSQYLEYNKDGMCTSTEIRSGMLIEIDDLGRSSIQSFGTLLSSEKDEYNQYGWLLKSLDTNGLSTQYTYNYLGDITEVRREMTDGSWMVKRTVYDDHGHILFDTDWFSAEKNQSNIRGVESLIDERFRNTGAVYYLGCMIEIGHDGNSRIISKGAELYRETTVYDEQGRVVSATDVYGNVTTYEYDPLNRVSAVNNAAGVRTENTYDNLDRIIESRTINGETDKITKYVYDSDGNIIKTTLPDGNIITATYNSDGQVISEQNQLGQTRHFEYDEQGQLVKVTMPAVFDPVAGQTKAVIYEYAYDHNGNQISIIDPNGNITAYTYDSFGNQQTRTLPDGSTEYFEYDTLTGLLNKHISFEGVVAITAYDDYWRVASITYYASVTDFNNNLQKEVWHYEYDAFGNVVTIDQNGRLTSTEYNQYGQVLSICTPEGTIYYEYDIYGRQVSVALDSGEKTSYSYDVFGRLSSVTEDDLTAHYEYDAFGNLARTRLSNGNTTVYQYDIMDRLVRMQNFIDSNHDGVFNSGDQSLSEFTYGLDALGQKRTALETFWHDIDNDGTIDELINSISWEYDNMGRLTMEYFDHYLDENDQISEWVYDLAGNRIRQSVNGSDTSYLYDTNDRLLNEKTSTSEAEYNFSGTQQIGKRITADGKLVSEQVYEYDTQGRMSRVITISYLEDGTIASQEKVSYGYGPDGIRYMSLHEIDEDGDGNFELKKRTEYVNDPLNISGYSQVLKETLYDENEDASQVITYVIGNQRISQIIVNNGTEQEFYFTFDGHGSTRVLLDYECAVKQIYSFDAYGNALGFDPAESATEFLYSGEQFDSKIGQQYLRQRYYNPSNGRFNRLDPFYGNTFDPQSLHKYTYTHNNPVMGVDPSGLMTVGGMLSSIRIGVQSMGSNAIAIANAAKNIRTFAQVVELTQKIAAATNTLGRAYDTLSIIYDLISFDVQDILDIQAHLKDMRDTMFSTPGSGLGPAQISAYKDFTLKKMRGRLGSVLNSIGKNNAFTEFLGEFGTVAICQALGMTRTDISVKKHGFDAVMYEGKTDRLCLIEAKGGTGVLDPGQMLDTWIKANLAKLMPTYANTVIPTAPNNGTFGQYVNPVVQKLPTKGMWVLVSKVTTKGGQPKFAVQLQTFQGVDTWKTPFRSTSWK